MADDKSKDVVVSSSISEEGKQVVDAGKLSRKTKGRRWFKIVAMVFVLAAAVFYWMELRTVGWKGSPESTGLAHPSLNASGRVDYFKTLESLYPKEMKTKDNVVRRLIEQFGPGPFAKLFELHPGYKEYFYEQLGLDIQVKPLSAWLDIKNDARAWLEEKYPGDSDDMLHKRNGRWALFCDKSADTLDGAELVAWQKECDQFCLDWLKRNEPAMTKLGDILQGKIFCSPFIPPDDTDILPALLAERHEYQSDYAQRFVDIFMLRAGYRCQQGDFTGALADVSVVRRLARTIIATEPRFVQTDTFAWATDKLTLLFDFNLYGNFRPDKDFLTTYARLFSDYLCEGSDESAMSNTLQFGVFPLVEALSENRHAAASYEIPVSSWQGYDWNAVVRELLYYKDHLDDMIKLEKEAVNLPEKTMVVRRAKLFTIDSRSKLLAWDICHAVIPRLDSYCESGHLNRCMVNVRRIILAMELYRCEHKTYPPAFTVDSAGKPLQSWRVLLLPYLGEKEKALYAKIKLQEPWNSEYNKQFHEMEVAVYDCPSSLKPENKNGTSVHGRTAYAVVVGKDALFDKSGKGKPCPSKLEIETPLNPFPGILVAERHRTMCWMNPAHEIEEKNLFKGVNCTWSRVRLSGLSDRDPGPIKRFPSCLDSMHRGFIVVGEPNGRVRFVSQTLGGAL